MIPPNKNHLQALAGWAIAAAGNCSDQQHLALGHFRDGCGKLAEVIEDIKPVSQPAPQAPPTPRNEEPFVVSIPVEVLQLERPNWKEGDACSHRFDIRTQVCRYCGQSYRQAMGRKPELF